MMEFLSERIDLPMDTTVQKETCAAVTNPTGVLQGIEVAGEAVRAF
jgi:hypothetical protein